MNSFWWNCWRVSCSFHLSLQLLLEPTDQFVFVYTLKRYKWMTYGEAGTARSAIGSGLVYHGIPKVSDSIDILFRFSSFWFYYQIWYSVHQHLYVLYKHWVEILQSYNLCDCSSWLLLLQGTCVGLHFINRPEWLIVDHACSAYSYISVPLYDTLG